MKIRSSLVACAVAGALAAVSMSAMACSTVIVGKDASATGDILIGHNEASSILNIMCLLPACQAR